MNIKNAVDVAQRAQRNYDRSKSIPDEDLETLIYAAENSPSKQNETHYALKVYTNKTYIEKIYRETKEFALYLPGESTDVFDDSNPDKLITKKENNIYNSQILANALFVYFLDVGHLRSGHHVVSQWENSSQRSRNRLEEQQSFSIGVSAGELILSAALLGYKTGICSALRGTPIKEICGTELEPKLLVGVGYENVGVDRRLAAETLNKDVPERYRTGPDNEKFRFPTFDKEIKVELIK